MDLSELKREIDAVIPHLQRALHLEDWDVEVVIGPCLANHGAAAEVGADAAYESATVRIDPEAIDDVEDLHRKMLHELLHALLSEIGHLDGVGQAALEPLGVAAVAAYKEASAYVSERQVRAVEKLILKGIGLPPTALATGRWKLTVEPWRPWRGET